MRAVTFASCALTALGLVLIAGSGCGSGPQRRAGQTELFVAEYYDEFDAPMTSERMRTEGARLVPAISFRDRERKAEARVDPDYGDPIRYNDDVVTVQVLSAYIDHVPWTLSDAIKNRVDVILFAEVWENAADSYGAPSLNRIVYVAQDQEVPGRLNFLGNLAYGPTLYKGHPMKIKFTLMILQKRTNEAFARAGTAASTISNFVSSAAVTNPWTGLASQAVSVVREVLRNQSDVIAFDFEATLMSDMPEGLLPTVLEASASGSAKRDLLNGTQALTERNAVMTNDPEVWRAEEKWSDALAKAQGTPGVTEKELAEVFGPGVKETTASEQAFKIVRDRSPDGAADPVDRVSGLKKANAERETMVAEARKNVDSLREAASKMEELAAKAGAEHPKLNEIKIASVPDAEKPVVLKEFAGVRENAERLSVDLGSKGMVLSTAKVIDLEALKAPAANAPQAAVVKAAGEAAVSARNVAEKASAELRTAEENVAAEKKRVEALSEAADAYRGVVSALNESIAKDEKEKRERLERKTPRSNRQLRPMTSPWNKTMAWLDYGVYALIETQKQKPGTGPDGLPLRRALFELDFHKAFRFFNGWLTKANKPGSKELRDLVHDEDARVQELAKKVILAQKCLAEAKGRATSWELATHAKNEPLFRTPEDKDVAAALKTVGDQSRSLAELKAELLKSQRQVALAEQQLSQAESDMSAYLAFRSRMRGEEVNTAEIRRRTMIPDDRLDTNYVVFSVTPGQIDQDGSLLADAARLDAELRARLMVDPPSAEDLDKSVQDAAVEVAAAVMNRKLTLLAKSAAREASAEANDAAGRVALFRSKTQALFASFGNGLDSKGDQVELKKRFEAVKAVLTDQWVKRLEDMGAR